MNEGHETRFTELAKEVFGECDDYEPTCVGCRSTKLARLLDETASEGIFPGDIVIIKGDIDLAIQSIERHQNHMVPQEIQTCIKCRWVSCLGGRPIEDYADDVPCYILLECRRRAPLNGFTQVEAESFCGDFEACEKTEAMRLREIHDAAIQERFKKQTFEKTYSAIREEMRGEIKESDSNSPPN